MPAAPAPHAQKNGRQEGDKKPSERERAREATPPRTDAFQKFYSAVLVLVLVLVLKD